MGRTEKTITSNPQFKILNTLLHFNNSLNCKYRPHFTSYLYLYKISVLLLHPVFRIIGRKNNGVKFRIEAT